MRAMLLRSLIVLLVSASLTACVGGVRSGGDDAGTGGEGEGEGSAEGEGEGEGEGPADGEGEGPAEGEGEGPAEGEGEGPAEGEGEGPAEGEGEGATGDLAFADECRASAECSSGLCAVMGSCQLCTRDCGENACRSADWACQHTRLAEGAEVDVCFYSGAMCQ